MNQVVAITLFVLALALIVSERVDRTKVALEGGALAAVHPRRSQVARRHRARRTVAGDLLWLGDLIADLMKGAAASDKGLQG